MYKNTAQIIINLIYVQQKKLYKKQVQFYLNNLSKNFRTTKMYKNSAQIIINSIYVQQKKLYKKQILFCLNNLSKNLRTLKMYKNSAQIIINLFFVQQKKLYKKQIQFCLNNLSKNFRTLKMYKNSGQVIINLLCARQKKLNKKQKEKPRQFVEMKKLISFLDELCRQNNFQSDVHKHCEKKVGKCTQRKNQLKNENKVFFFSQFFVTYSQLTQ